MLRQQRIEPPLRPSITSGLWRVELKTAVIGLTVYTVAVAVMGWIFTGVAPAIWLTIWLTVMALPPVIGATAAARTALHGISEAELARIWFPLSFVARLLMIVGGTASVWILMPSGDASMRMIVIVFDIGFVAMIALVSAERSSSVIATILAVFASAILCLIAYPTPYRWALIAMLALFAGALLLAQTTFRRATVDAMAARAEADQARSALQAALKVVVAERDARTRFIRSAAHDLQQPLQATALFFDQMLQAGDTDSRERSAAGVQRGLRSTRSLVEHMLVHLKLEANMVEARVGVVSVASLFDAVQRDHKPGIQAAGMRMVAVGRHLHVMADPHLLRRLLDNLVSNAVQHSQGERILLGARKMADGVILWVIDDGRGIPESERDLMFTDFVRGTGGPSSGFGLGLPSVRRLAEVLGGTTGLDPRWNSGAGFYVELPTVSPRELDRAMEAAG